MFRYVRAQKIKSARQNHQLKDAVSYKANFIKCNFIIYTSKRKKKGLNLVYYFKMTQHKDIYTQPFKLQKPLLGCEELVETRKGLRF